MATKDVEMDEKFVFTPGTPTPTALSVFLRSSRIVDLFLIFEFFGR